MHYSQGCAQGEALPPPGVSPPPGHPRGASPTTELVQGGGQSLICLKKKFGGPSAGADFPAFSGKISQGGAKKIAPAKTFK